MSVSLWARKRHLTADLVLPVVTIGQIDPQEALWQSGATKAARAVPAAASRPLIATSFFDASVTSVRRWSKAARDYVTVPCSATMRKYQKLMGFVDQFNKKLSAAGMSMGCCKQRFHRALALGWLLPAIVNARRMEHGMLMAILETALVWV